MTTVFISYSWDSDFHKKRVKEFVEYLRKHQIKVIFDGDARLGEPLPDFMEKGVRDSDYVLMCLTPIYKKKADGRLNKESGGVVYENTIITGEIYRRNNQYKFIPVLFEGTWELSTPYWAIGKLGVDLRENIVKSEIERLLKTLNGKMPDDVFFGSCQIPDEEKAKKKKSNKRIIVFIIIIAVVIVAALFGVDLIKKVIVAKENTPVGTYISESDFVEKSVKSDIDLSMEELLNTIWEDSNYIRSQYIKNLIGTGIRRYNRKDFSCAGALFEQAIIEGDEGVTAKNNLSFMIRRQEYKSENYELEDLLKQCRENGGAFASINYAMYLVSVNEWEEADLQFKMITSSDPEIKECIDWWKGLYDQNEPEGSLVLGWLLKYGFYEDKEKTASDYFEEAKQYYEDMPDSLYSESDSD